MLLGSIVIGDISAVLGFGGAVGTRQVVNVVAAPARHGVAVLGGPLDAPDLDRFGRADPVDQLLEVDGFPVIVETTRGLLALEHIQDAGVGAAVFALTDPN
jgi:hypothetical protein